MRRTQTLNLGALALVPIRPFVSRVQWTPAPVGLRVHCCGEAVSTPLPRSACRKSHPSPQGKYTTSGVRHCRSTAPRCRAPCLAPSSGSVRRARPAFGPGDRASSPHRAHTNVAQPAASLSQRRTVGPRPHSRISASLTADAATCPPEGAVPAPARSNCTTPARSAVLISRTASV